MIDGLITGTVNVALLGLVAVIRRLVHHEGLAAFGLEGGARGRRLLLAGLATGTLAFSTYPIAAVTFGVGRVFVVWPALAHTLAFSASWGFGFAGVALFEEGLFRGYLLPKLQGRFRSAAAIAGQAALFAAFHLMAYAQNPYAWLGAVNVGILAVITAVLVLRTQSLMLAIGFHVAWDLVQTVLLTDQITGITGVLNLHVDEGIWTGTARTPETGLIVSAALVGFGVIVASTRSSRRPFRRWASDRTRGV
jgi:membrane protease YdiL (CAAX protease family)